MNIKKLKLDLDCEVLKQHDARFQKERERVKLIYPELSDISQSLTIKHLGIYSNRIEKICLNHRIDEAQKTHVQHFLENLALLYLSGKRFAPVAHNLPHRMKTLRDIEVQAVKLEKIILDFGESPKVLDILFENGIFKTNKNEQGRISKLFTRLSDDLFELQKLSKIIEESELGKDFKVGQFGPKGNPENAQWVQLIRWMWFELLDRDFKFDPKRKSGRENFLLFAEDSFEILYPGAKEDLVRKTLEQMEKGERLAPTVGQKQN